MFFCFVIFRIIIFDLYCIRNGSSNSANFPIFGGHARLRGRRFGSLAQTFGRKTIPFIKKYIVPAVKGMGANIFENAAPEIGEIPEIGRENLNTSAL